MDPVDEREMRLQSQMQMFHSTLTLIHGQTAAINDRINAEEAQRKKTAPAQTAPAVVSHRGFGAIPSSS